MFKSFVSIVLFQSFAVAQSSGVAEPTPSLSGVTRLNRAPVSEAIPQFRLPRPVPQTLPNGLRAVFLEDHRAPIVSLMLFVPCSRLDDAPELPGLSDATAALVRLGTTKRSAEDIATVLSGMGSTLSLSAGPESTTITLTSLTDQFAAAVGVLGDLLANASFPEDEIAKWKRRQLAAIQQDKTSPVALANAELYSLLYSGDQRSRRRITTTTVTNLRRGDLLKQYHSCYVPSGQLLGVAGDIRPSDALPILTKAFADWTGKAPEIPMLPLQGPIEKRRVLFIPRPGSSQALLLLTNRAFPRHSPDFIAGEVLNEILGAGPASRLFRIIREEKGYTYGISSEFTALRYFNHSSIATAVRNDVTGLALEEILRQMGQIQETPVGADELAAAKRLLIARFSLTLESPVSILSRRLAEFQYDLGADYWEHYPARVNAITAADIQRVAKLYLPTKGAQIIAVGDPAIQRQLSDFGEVEKVLSPLD